MTTNARRIRPAVASDHADYERLVRELEVEDPPMSLEKFVLERVPTMIVMEAGEGAPDPKCLVGYGLFQLIAGLAYVRHIVTAPEARKTGVGRALMAAIAARARAADCTSWCLNVKRGNTAALALYAAVGMAPAFDTKVVRMDWASVEAAPSNNVHDTRFTARLLAPADDARVESTLGLLSGQLAIPRNAGGRVLMGLFDGEAVIGATVFDPAYPGAYPFRAARPEVALPLLRAIRPHARPSDAHVQIVSEDQPEIAEVLLAAGAKLVHELVHMKGALPPLGADSPRSPTLSADR